MSVAADPVANDPPKASKIPLILGIVLALIGGIGGFWGVQNGLFGGDSDAPTEDAELSGDHDDLPDLGTASFLPLDTIVVNLPNTSGQDLLRFSAQLEVQPQYLAEVDAIKPRIVDVLNSYLRAVDVVDLADPTSLVRLRSQMLRRVQVVTGQGRVTDLLIMEFVLN